MNNKKPDVMTKNVVISPESPDIEHDRSPATKPNSGAARPTPDEYSPLDSGPETALHW